MPIALDLLCPKLVETGTLVEPARRVENLRIGAPKRLGAINALDRERHDSALAHEYTINQLPPCVLNWLAQWEDVVFCGLRMVFESFSGCAS